MYRTTYPYCIGSHTDQKLSATHEIFPYFLGPAVHIARAQQLASALLLVFIIAIALANLFIFLLL